MMEKLKHTKILCILDGFGLRTEIQNNCIAHAHMPHLRKIMDTYPWITLYADGEYVGQEEGLVGNSEVGHMNIGGLKKVPQLSYQITKSATHEYEKNSEYSPDQYISPCDLFSRDSDHISHASIHIISLLSSGKVHSDMRHIAAAISCAARQRFKRIILHVITDGRDTAKNKSREDITLFRNTYQELFLKYGDIIHIGSVSGRFYAMDRDNNNERTRRAVFHMISPSDQENHTLQQYMQSYMQGVDVSTPQIPEISHQDGKTDSFTRVYEYIEQSYSQAVFDEHIVPHHVTSSDGETNSMKNGDYLWFINYRTDRYKQIVRDFVQINNHAQCHWRILANNDYGISDMTPYTTVDTHIKTDSYYALFKTQPVKNPLAHVVSEYGLSQLHIAETEKFNHVTYFLNGGQNTQFSQEAWHVIPSYKISNHAEKPQMRAEEVTDYILEHGVGIYDVIVVNYANPDMVGHTGDFYAGVKSLEVLDAQLGRLYEYISHHKECEMVITADHGNIELVGEYHTDHGATIDTEHNPHAVPCIFVSQRIREHSNDFVSHIRSLSDAQVCHISRQEYRALDTFLHEWDMNPLLENKKSIILSNIPHPLYSLYMSGIFFLGLVTWNYE